MRRNTSARETGEGKEELVPEGPCPWQPLCLPVLSSCPHCLPGTSVAASGILEKSGGNPRCQQMQALMLLLGFRSHNALGETVGWESGGPGLQARHVPGPGDRWITELSFLLRGRGLEEGHTDTPDMGRSSRQLGGVQCPHTEGQLNTEAETVLHTKTHSSYRQLEPHRHKSNDAPRTFLSLTHTHSRKTSPL